MNLQISCTSCAKPFSLANPPRIAKKCTHTYCQECIRSIQLCPMDKYSIDFKNNIEDFPINRTIAKMMKLDIQSKEIRPNNTKKQQQIDLCLLHNKEADLVCLEDQVRICSNCALFGEHKMHMIKTVDNTIEQCTSVAEQVVQVLGQLKETQQRVSIQGFQEKMERLFKQKKDVLVKNIKARYFKLIQKLRKCQQISLAQLEQTIENSKQQIRKSIKLQQIQIKKHNWIKQADDLILLIDSISLKKKIQQATKYLNDKQKESGIVKRGEYLMIQISNFQKIMMNKLSNSVEDIATEIDSQTQKQVEGFCKIYKISERNKLQISHEQNKHQKLDDDFLLQQLEKLDFSSKINETHISSTSISQTEIPTINQPLTISPGLNERSERILEKSFIKQPLIQLPTNQTAEIKKKKKLKIPQKYQNIIEDLRLDRADCIDLTNAELGDAIILNICQYIKNTVKVKNLKLIRNKLSDQCLLPLLQACRQSKITSINLGQNFLTDKAIQILSKCEIKELRSITLSQNKLNQRNCKNKVNEFKKTGLTISL